MRVAIVGGSPSTQMMAPFDDEEWEIWVLGNQLQQYEGKRVTRIFEIHDDLSEHDPDYAAWLASHNIQMVVSDKFPIPYSYIKIFDKNKSPLQLFSSSPAYMMAQAIMDGAKTIAIYGVDMAIDNHEYFKQRADMYAWIGYAKGLGIEVIIPEASSLFKSKYDEGRDYNVSKGPFCEHELLKLAKMHTEQVSYYQKLVDSHDGARQVYERLAKVARSCENGIDVKTLTETVRIPDEH